MQDVPHRRLIHQQIAGADEPRATKVVRHLGAMQAQDYRNALWAVGLRTARASEASIERAIAKGEIVRTWPIRGTVHFVAAEDVHWMLELLTPRVLSAAANRALQLGLDAATLSRCAEITLNALAGEQQLTREALLARIEAAGIATGPQRGYHILWRLAQQRLICNGPRAGNSPTFVLLDEWVPPKKRFTPKQPLAELAQRYFSSHGPATLQDFVWWSGLKVADARLGVLTAALTQESIDGVTFWSSGEAIETSRACERAYFLPAFDEYLLGYKDRTAVLDKVHAPRIVPGGNGVFLPFIAVNGRVVGTWKRNINARSAAITVTTFNRASRSVREDIAAAAEDYGRFIGLPIDLRFTAVLR